MAAERGPLPVRPETEPDELELELAAGPARKGETGEPKSSSRKSGLLVLSAEAASQVSEFRRRSESVSNPKLEMGLLESAIELN